MYSNRVSSVRPFTPKDREKPKNNYTSMRTLFDIARTQLVNILIPLALIVFQMTFSILSCPFVTSLFTYGNPCPFRSFLCLIPRTPFSIWSSWRFKTVFWRNLSQTNKFLPLLSLPKGRIPTSTQCQNPYSPYPHPPPIFTCPHAHRTTPQWRTGDDVTTTLLFLPLSLTVVSFTTWYHWVLHLKSSESHRRDGIKCPWALRWQSQLRNRFTYSLTEHIVHCVFGNCIFVTYEITTSQIIIKRFGLLTTFKHHVTPLLSFTPKPVRWREDTESQKGRRVTPPTSHTRDSVT